MADDKPQGDPASLGIPPLLDHLNAITSNPSTPLEKPLFEKVLNELAFYNLPFPTNQQTYHTLLTHLIATLPILTTDDSVRTVTTLIDALLTRMPIRAVLSFIPPPMLIAALSAPHPAANLLGMTIIKRAEGPEGVSAVLRRDVVDALVERWMGAEAVEVGQRGEEALLNLLEGTRTDLVGATKRLSLEDMVNGDAGAKPELDIWDDVLRGPSAVAIVEACVNNDDERQASLSQNRLLALLPRVARLDFDALVSTAIPRRPAHSNTLLQMAIEMVDRDDVAMYLVLVQFYKDLFRDVYEVVGSNPGTRTRFEGFVRGKRGDTALVRAVGELRREVQADEELNGFGEWITSVVGTGS